METKLIQIAEKAKDSPQLVFHSLAHHIDKACLKSGRYKAPDIRRAWIPKGDGQGKRKLGIPKLLSYYLFYSLY